MVFVSRKDSNGFADRCPIDAVLVVVADILTVQHAGGFSAIVTACQAGWKTWASHNLGSRGFEMDGWGDCYT